MFIGKELSIYTVPFVEKGNNIINKSILLKRQGEGMFRKKLEDMMNDEHDKLIIDLRTKQEYDKETYPGAIHIFYEDFYKYLNVLPKNKRIYLFCYTGVTGDEIAEDLSKDGYDIYSIEDGYRAILRMNVHRMMDNKRIIDRGKFR